MTQLLEILLMQFKYFNPMDFLIIRKFVWLYWLLQRLTSLISSHSRKVLPKQRLFYFLHIDKSLLSGLVFEKEGDGMIMGKYMDHA